MTTVDQLGNKLCSQITQLEEHNNSLELVATNSTIESQQLCESIRSNQCDFVNLMEKLKKIQTESTFKIDPNPDAKTMALTPLQQANIERSLFYLQQISDFFRVKFQKSIFSSVTHLNPGGKALVSVNSMTRRKTLHSARSELILKRISRELMLPIREQYNEMYMKNVLLQEKANRLNGLRFKQLRKSCSQTTISKRSDAKEVKHKAGRPNEKLNARQETRAAVVKDITPKSTVTLKF